MVKSARPAGAEDTGEEAAAPEKPAKKVVRFKDARHYEERRISVADWKKVGVEEGARDVVWYSGNNFEVPFESFGFLTEDEFRRYIEADARLEVVTV